MKSSKLDTGQILRRLEHVDSSVLPSRRMNNLSLPRGLTHKVHYSAPFSTITGYSSSAINFVSALHKYVPVRIDDQNKVWMGDLYLRRASELMSECN